MRVVIMVLTVLLIPNIVFAGLASVIGETFGPSGPAHAVIWLIGLSVGRWIIKTVISITGGSGQWIDMIVRCAECGIVIAAVYGLMNTAFNLLGL
ncbi:MAG: hypothetical protein H6Q73_943 [Firmicutes bacterium]|nr:hypothetical protein [Bacillota bacterium]